MSATKVSTWTLLLGLVVAGVLLLSWRVLHRSDLPDPTDARLRAAPAAAPAEERSRVAHPDATSRAPVEALPAEPGMQPAEPASLPATTVTARVLDEEGAPLSSARVRARDESPLIEVAADPAGAVELALPAPDPGSPARRWVLEFRAPGHAVVLRTVEPGAARHVGLGDVRLPRGGVVRGTVLDADRSAVEHARVALARRGTTLDPMHLPVGPFHALSEPGPLARTDADGSFRLAGVAAGRWRLVAGAPGHGASLSAPVEVRPGGEVGGVELRLRETPPAARIEGQVLAPDGTPVAGARLRVRSPLGVTRTRVDDTGRFRIDAMGGEPHDLVAEDPRGRFGPSAADSVPVGTLDLRLRLRERLEVAVTVRSSAGEPLERVEVQLLDEAGERALAAPIPGEGSTATFPAPDGAFLVRVAAPRHAVASLGPFGPAAIPASIPCVLEPLAPVTGRVLAAGRPLPGAAVSLHAALEEPALQAGFPLRSDPTAHDRATTDGRGEFRAGVRVAGRYFLRAEAEGHAPAELGPLRLEPGRPSAGHELDLTRGGSIRGRVRASAGEDVAGRLVAASRGDGHARTTRSGEDGSFRLDLLTPGEWSVALVEVAPRPGDPIRLGRSPAVAAQTCRVPEGGRADVVLDTAAPAPGTCRLRGSLRLDGQPAADWVVRLTPLEDGSSGTRDATTDASGDFEVAADRPGPHRLMLRSSVSATDVFFLDVVDLVPGVLHWSLAVDTGALEGSFSTGPAPPDTLTFHAWRGGEHLLGLAPLVPDATGAFRCPRVVSGAGRIVRYATGVAFEQQEGVELLRVDVEPGSTSTARL